MVKKKGKSKRTTLKDKYKIDRRVKETHLKRKKQAKRDEKAGKVVPKKKDPGIPNSWPFKQDLLKDIQRTRERQQQKQVELKEKRKNELKMLREHQEQGGSARTVQELVDRASQSQAAFEEKQPDNEMSDGTVAAGQASRRAYLRELKKVVDSADVLLQVLDARDPLGSRIHPTIEDTILAQADKRMVLVLNKIDLVPKQVVADWLQVLRKSHPTIAIKASQEKSVEEHADAASTSIPVGMDGLLQLLKNYARTGGTGGKSKTTIVVGILGYPNVGKSSIINALKRSRAVGVSSRPGSTASMQEVVLDRNVRLLDSPGVVFNDKSTLLGCVDAHSMDDPIPPVEAILERCDHSSLLMTYNIPTFPAGNVMVFLAMVAKSHGRVLKGGIPDKVAAARTVLRDWNSGKIPYYTPAPDIEMDDSTSNTNNSNNTQAVIVSQMSKELNLEKLDQEVMNSLEDRDEMDFVQLKEGSKKETTSMDVDRAVKILKGESSGNDDDGDDNMDLDDGKKKRSKLNEADDYDFDDM
ncbi:nucleotide-binding protein-like 3 [Seminavis robusta]|uniref:Nucleotide-binding protein-like 3 n=1 Tax=Seminavis robusta TaxID=568900 RepID=A0A9N8DJH4_9STRA|nr:nucleotide-binding protein-like 3 [Seminavis robusta]|eukprot:Sro93_g048510.1 nucleotide-binding protein-like 3 (525) ;mRNA; f:66653-68347